MKGITVALCIDSRGGMMFNGRRQMKDAEVISDIMARFAEGNVFVTEYSARLFEKYDNVFISADPISECGEGDLCFIEDPRLLAELDEVTSLVVYNWGIPYPADRYFEIDMRSAGFKRISRDKLSTLVHNRITRELYRKN